MNETIEIKDGTKLIYLHEDGGRVTDTNVWLAPGEDNAVVVGQDLSRELAEAFVARGICAVCDAKAEAAPDAVPDKVDPAPEAVPGSSPQASEDSSAGLSEEAQVDEAQAEAEAGRALEEASS